MAVPDLPKFDAFREWVRKNVPPNKRDPIDDWARKLLDWCRDARNEIETIEAELVHVEMQRDSLRTDLEGLVSDIEDVHRGIKDLDEIETSVPSLEDV